VLRAEYADWSRDIAWQWPPHSVTWRLVSPSGEVRYLKLARHGWTPSISDEASRMMWARDHLPVPMVVGHGQDSSVQWMVTAGLDGRNAADSRVRADPDRLVCLLARGLRRFHEAPVGKCPFDFRLDTALRMARDRLERGVIDPVEAFHSEHSGLTAAGAVATLERTRPDRQDLVVCHGDYCPPNILIAGDEVRGYVDLGELGVADRWWDLAVATWSITWNLGPGYEELFLSEYGAELDRERLVFYRLLYDVVS
jgi:kanamycin kinase